MSSLQLKRSRSPHNPGRRRRLILITAVIAALAIALGVTIFVLVTNNQRMSQGRAQIESGILSDLTMIQRTYEKFAEPKADIGGQLLPEISKHLYSAYTQDTVLSEMHGRGAQILGNELYSKINSAIEAMEKQIKADRIISPKENELTPFIAQIQAILDARLGDGGGNNLAWGGMAAA